VFDKKQESSRSLHVGIKNIGYQCAISFHVTILGRLHRVDPLPQTKVAGVCLNIIAGLCNWSQHGSAKSRPGSSGCRSNRSCLAAALAGCRG
jgi:hypothetical protein